jgi:hypothetical protein
MDSLASLPSERQCHKQLYKIVRGKFACPYCDGKILLRDRYVWCGKCRKKYSVRSETWFRGSKLSFQKIWLLIWCWQKKKSIGATKDISGVTYPTIRKWFRQLRRTLPKIYGQKLSGFVEVDESFFGKRKYGRQTIVIGAIERGSRKLRLKIIKDRGRRTLERFTVAHVALGSDVRTDYHEGYNELFLYGYRHERCNHSIGHFGSTNTIENMWGVIKRHLRSLYCNLSITDLKYILIEWENRQNNPALFYNVVSYLRASACSG